MAAAEGFPARRLRRSASPNVGLAMLASSSSDSPRVETLQGKRDDYLGLFAVMASSDGFPLCAIEFPGTLLFAIAFPRKIGQNAARVEIPKDCGLSGISFESGMDHVALEKPTECVSALEPDPRFEVYMARGHEVLLVSSWEGFASKIDLGAGMTSRLTAASCLPLALLAH